MTNTPFLSEADIPKIKIEQAEDLTQQQPKNSNASSELTVRLVNFKARLTVNL